MNSTTLYNSEQLFILATPERYTFVQNFTLNSNHEFLAGGEADWAKFGFVRNVVAQRSRND